MRGASWVLLLCLVSGTIATGEPDLGQQLQELVDADKNQQAIALGEAQLPHVKATAQIYYLLTLASYGVDDHTRTRRYATKTLEIEPSHEWAARFYVTASRSMEAYGEGLDFGRLWVKNNTTGSDIYKDMALLAHDAGRIDEAKELAAEAFKRKPESSRIAGVHFYFICRGDTATAGAAAAREWADQYKTDAFFWAQIGKGLSDANKSAEALPFLLRALKEGSDDRGVPDEIMDSYRELDDRAAAAKFLETYGATHEIHAYLWRALGAMHYDAEAYGEALTAFQKAKKLNPENAVSIANLVFTLTELKRANEGIEEGQHWLNLEHNTATPGFHRAMGNAYFARDRWLEAEPHYREAVRLDSTRIHDARELLVTLLKLERPEDAVRFGDEWQSSHPDLHDRAFTDALKDARGVNAARKTSSTTGSTQ